ncbi:hypothetical protein AURDEDRAFT_115898 [Auricularia subglabra TFB-10046 SS5]|nr:hypothetical protein AURDEDRAFT_115898 [Auricularia subglabra TFB-10046 SS5]
MSFWTGVPGPIRMRVRDNGKGNDFLTLATLVTESGTRRIRKFEFANWERYDGTPLDELAFLAPRLTYIRLENEFLSGLLLFGCALPALRRLWIDLPYDTFVRGVIMPFFRQDYNSSVESLYSYAESSDSDAEAQPVERACRLVPCNALENLTLFATEQPVEVDSVRLSLLARALGQDARAASDRALLRLVGVLFRKGEESETVVDVVPEVFSSVEHRDFQGEGSLEARELGVWDT